MRQQRINLSVPEDLYRLIQTASEDSGKSEQDVIRDRLRMAFDQDDITGVGQLARALIANGLTNKQVVEEILKAKPLAKTTTESVSWYRSKMRSAGEDVPTDRDARELQRSD